MLNRNLSPELIVALQSSPFWNNVRSEIDLQPEIRDDAVTVYYRGGAMLGELRLLDGTLIADVHHKFVPLQRMAASATLRLACSGPAGLQFARPPEPLPFGLGDSLVLSRYREVMAATLKPEGELIQRIVTYPDKKNQIIDQQIVFSATGESTDEIDLCHFDDSQRKILFIEVKRREDARLTEPREAPEVLDQLDGYSRRLKRHRAELLDQCRRVVSCKRSLGLGDRLQLVPDDGASDLLEKPILVIGRCSRDDVRQIQAGEGRWAKLRKELPEVAAGLILCGNDGCWLNLTARNQVLIF